MALTRTAALLTADVRQRADMPSTVFRSDPQIRRYLSESCRSLVSVLVDEFEELYWATSFGLNTVAGVQTSSLDAFNVWKLVMLRVTLDGKRVPIKKASVDRVDLEASSVGGWSLSQKPRYRLIGRQLYWVPIPRAVHAVGVYAVPTKIFFSNAGAAKEEFTAADDYFDGIFGWEQIAVLDSAIKLLRDEKKDTAELRQELSDRWSEVREAARDQHGIDPPRVRLTWRTDELDGLDADEADA